MTKTITTAISTKATKRSPSTVVEGAFADITPGVSIRLYGEHKGYRKDGGLYDLTFKIGDVAEYDSYNLNYLGTSEKITAKTVTIRPRHGEKVRRLSLHEFNWRNRHFDLEAIAASNADTMRHI